MGLNPNSMCDLGHVISPLGLRGREEWRAREFEGQIRILYGIKRIY